MTTTEVDTNLDGTTAFVTSESPSQDTAADISITEPNTGTGHSHGITDNGHTHAGGSHTHTFNDGGHTHTFNDSGHTHTFNDGGHTHTFNDGGHTHTAGTPASVTVLIIERIA